MRQRRTDYRFWPAQNRAYSERPCARNHGEQPDRADPVGLVVEGDLELGEVGIGLPAGPRLEASSKERPPASALRTGISVTAV